MENENFKKALAFVLKWEGGYSNDPQDPGKETNFGISSNANPDVNVKKLNREEASKLYWDRYWMPSGAFYLPWALCVVVFDAAVLHGPQTAKNFYKRASADPKNKTPQDLSLAVCDYRLDLFNDIVARKPTMKKYLKGWRNRINDLKNLILDPKHEQKAVVKKAKIG